MKKSHQKMTSLAFKGKLMHALTLFFLVSLLAGCNQLEKILKETKDIDEDQFPIIEDRKVLKLRK